MSPIGSYFMLQGPLPAQTPHKIAICKIRSRCDMLTGSYERLATWRSLSPDRNRAGYRFVAPVTRVEATPRNGQRGPGNFWQTWCRILQPFRHIRCTGPKCDRRRAGARRLSITKEWCYGPRNAPPASGHCPYSRPAPKPNRRGRPPVSARIARRLDDLLERVALLPIGEPPRPQVRPADKPYSIAFLCSYACGTNSLSRIYVRASTVI